MTHEEHSDLIEILKQPRFDTRLKALKYVQGITPQAEEPEEEKTGSRTSQQNKALHVGFGLIANALNDAGLDIRAVLKPEVEIPWDTESVKEYLFRPVMKVMLQKESTKELNKSNGEIEKLWDVVLRHLATHHHIEYIPFPVDHSKDAERLGGYKTQAGQASDYPEYTGAPNFDLADNNEEDETDTTKA